MWRWMRGKFEEIKFAGKEGATRGAENGRFEEKFAGKERATRGAENGRWSRAELPWKHRDAGSHGQDGGTAVRKKTSMWHA